MKIDGLEGLGPAGRQNGVNRTVREHQTGQAAGQPDGDRFELSPEARQIASLGEKAAGLPDVRREKVEAIRQTLEDGLYEVDARMLAGKILEFEDGFGR